MTRAKLQARARFAISAAGPVSTLQPHPIDPPPSPYQPSTLTLSPPHPHPINPTTSPYQPHSLVVYYIERWCSPRRPPRSVPVHMTWALIPLRHSFTDQSSVSLLTVRHPFVQMCGHNAHALVNRSRWMNAAVAVGGRRRREERFQQGGRACSLTHAMEPMNLHISVYIATAEINE
jgi:hypothetical protein